jgi:hypothetical protein
VLTTLAICGAAVLLLVGLTRLVAHLQARWLAGSRMRVLVMVDLYLKMASLSYANAGEFETMNQMSLMRAFIRRLAVEEAARERIPLPEEFGTRLQSTADHLR